MYRLQDTCRKSILHCYVQELKTVVEEITLIGDEDAAEEITQKIDHIETNGNITFLEVCIAKTVYVLHITRSAGAKDNLCFQLMHFECG